MADLLYTFIFDMPGHGFTEQHWRQTTVQDRYVDQLAVGYELARRRQAMSGEQTIFQALRIANGIQEGRNGHTHAEAILGVPGKGSAASNVALNIRIGDTNNQHEKTTQFRGFWDDEEVTGGATLRSPAFMNAFNSWAQYFLAMGFGWRGIASEQVFPINGYEVSNLGIVTLNVTGILNNIMPLNKTKSVRISGLNSNKSQINGQQVAIYTGAGTGANTSSVMLKFPKAALPFSGMGFLHVQAYTFRDADTVELFGLGKRQAGAPLLRSRGRSGKRIRV
jgi:hypothetical protein